MCKSTFSTGFSGLVNEPAKPSKTVGHSIETISTGVAFCSYGYCRNHVGTLNVVRVLSLVFKAFWFLWNTVTNYVFEALFLGLFGVVSGLLVPGVLWLCLTKGFSEAKVPKASFSSGATGTATENQVAKLLAPLSCGKVNKAFELRLFC